jgi:monoamine oxidase
MSRSLIAVLNARFGSPRNGLTRRELLTKTMAGAGGLLLSTTGSADLTGRERLSGKRALVVGAGLAGLAAAHELAGVGYVVTVFEARNRPGGRVISFGDMVPGKVVEGGGEFIGAHHKTWAAFAQKFGLQFEDVADDDRINAPVVLRGKRLNLLQMARLWAELKTVQRLIAKDARRINADEPWKSPNAKALDRRSAADLMEKLPLSEIGKIAFSVYLMLEDNVPPARQSYLALLAAVKGGGLEEFWTLSEAYRCKGGNQHLAEKLAVAIGRKRLHFGTPVREIVVSEKGARLTLANGCRVEGDDVVLAVPPSVWNRIAFDPPLPPELNPQMGVGTKFLMALKSRFWKQSQLASECSTDGPISTTWDATPGGPDAMPTCFTAFSVADAADQCRSWEAEHREKNFLTALDSIYPGIGKHFTKGKFMDWPGDPWTRASYSCPSPGQVTTLGPTLHSGLGHLHFAGEHTSYAFGGYMEGALRSGVEVARRLAVRDGVRG